MGSAGYSLKVGNTKGKPKGNLRCCQQSKKLKNKFYANLLHTNSARACDSMSEEPQAEQTCRVEFDFETYVHVADKGPLTNFGLHDETTGSISFETLRILALRKGFSCLAGVPGHYLLNTHGAQKENQAARTYSLPAILHPIDEGSPAVYGLRWKVGENGNIYAITIPTDLKQKTDKDGVDQWLTDKDAVPRRLTLFKSIEFIENKDGHPMAKKFDSWLKDHSGYFGDLKIKSLAAARSWASHQNFGRNYVAVLRNAEAYIRAEVRQSTGQKTATQPKGNSKSTKTADATTTAEINRRCGLLNRAFEPMKQYVSIISVPLGHRIVELNLGEANDEVGEEKIQELLQSASPTSAVALFQLIKTSDKAKLLQQGQAHITHAFSPFPSPAKPAPAPAPAPEPEAQEAQDSDAEFSWIQNKDTADDPHLGKRVRNSTNNFSPSVNQHKKKKAQPPVKESTTKKASSSGSDKARRNYTKSGLFSKDPLKAAAARAALRQSDSEHSTVPIGVTYLAHVSHSCCP